MAFPMASGLQFTHWDFLLPSMNNFNIAQWVVMNSSDLSENQLSPKNDILRKRNDNNVDISVFIFVNKLCQLFDKNLQQIIKKWRLTWKKRDKVC